jgi:hypothetical protein
VRMGMGYWARGAMRLLFMVLSFPGEAPGVP